MNLTLVMSRPKNVIPYKHHHKVVGAFHKWLGTNVLHDELSLYSLSWLNGGKATKNGLKFNTNPALTISTPYRGIIHELAAGISHDPSFMYDMRVIESFAREPFPDFSDDFEISGTFVLGTPLFVKGQNSKFGLYVSKNLDEINNSISSLMHRKRERGEILEYPLHIEIVVADNIKEKTYSYRKDNVDIYHSANSNVKIKFTGHPIAVRFAAEVGIGNSTGIGYGYVKEVLFD